MAENLAFKTDSGCWAYDNDQSNVTKYGYLYNWQTAKNVCLSGWHLPSKEEFETLINNSGDSAEAAYKSLIPGGSTGFSAPFGGYRNYEGYFDFVERFAIFWFSSPDGDEYAWGLYIYSESSRATIGSDSRSCGYSVRCLKDN
jgi:uncharacterized protein (TIGR02145 family)